MGWTRKRLSELSDADYRFWCRMVSESDAFRSPFFRPELTKACDDVFPNVEVGLYHEGGILKGVFVYRREGETALPIAGGLTDFEGCIAPEGTQLSPNRMLASLGLCRWDFSHVPKLNSSVIHNCWMESSSPYVDLSQGFENYRDELFAQHPSIKKHFGKKLRQLAKAHGTAEARFDDSGEDSLPLMLKWKSEQYEASGREHPFRDVWTRSLMRRLLQEGSRDFQAFLIVLSIEEQPIAIEFILASGVVAHALVTAYDPSFSKWSPGVALQLKGLERLVERGFRIYDFGKGKEDYKQKFMSGQTIVCEGSADRNAVRQFSRAAFHRARFMFLESRFADPARTAARRAAARFPAIRNLLRMR